MAIRKPRNPACISEAIARACARAIRSAGQSERENLRAIFRDRQALPDPRPVMLQIRHHPIRRDRLHLRRVATLKRDHHLLACQPRQLHHQPAAQRPGGIPPRPDKKFCVRQSLLLADYEERRITIAAFSECGRTKTPARQSAINPSTSRHTGARQAKYGKMVSRISICPSFG